MIDLEKSNMDSHRNDQSGEVIGDPSAAEDHDTADLLSIAAEKTEEVRNAHHVAGHKHFVPLMNDK